MHFADGGDFMLRDPRRLGAVELDPDESRLGPDALTLTFEQLDHALDRRQAPVKAVLMDQHRVAGLGNLLVDESLWRAGIAPTRPPAAIETAERKVLHRSDPHRAAHPRPPRRVAHGRHAEGRRRGLPPGRDAAAAGHGRRPHHLLVPRPPALTPEREVARGPAIWC